MKMSSCSSFRIGRRSTPCTGRSHESGILRSLFELRKCCNDDSYPTVAQKSIELTFFNCQWTERIVKSLRKLIVRDGHRFSSIKFFDCEIANPKFAEIISMILSQNVTSKLVIKAKQGGTMNESLPLCESSTSNSSFDDSVLHAIRDGMSTNTSLRSLKLSGLQFKNIAIQKRSGDDADNSIRDDDHIWSHTLNKNSLLHLDLSDSYFSKSTISCIMYALFRNTTLQSISFGGCCLDDESLSQILRSVEKHPSLTKVDLSRNFLGQGVSTKALDAVAELLGSSDSEIETLDLSNQRSYGPTAMQTIMDVTMEQSEIEERHKIAFENALNALSGNKWLKKIDLSGNSGCFANLENVKALSTCLVTNTSLCHVDVSSCHLNVAGICYLGQKCIPRCSKKLKSLILFDSEISNYGKTETDEWTEAALSLERGLQFNSTLESMGEFNDTGMAFESKQNLEYLMNENRAGRRALQTVDLPLAVWPAILARAGRIEYDVCRDGENDGDDSIEVETSLSTVASASVLYALLHGPATLER